jgi:hypothetical protein
VGGARQRLIASVLATAALAAAGAAPAHADDLAAACETGTATVRASNGPGLFVSGVAPSRWHSTWNASGWVTCADASSIAIRSLTWRRPDGTTAEGGPRACVECSELFSIAEDVLGPSGDYVLTMRFDVTGPRGQIVDAERTRTYRWDGHQLAEPDAHWTTSCPSGPGTATLGMQHDAYGTRVSFSGTLSCPGADAVAIDSLVAYPVVPEGAKSAGTRPTCSAPCSSVTARGSMGASNNRFYEVVMSASARSGTRWRSMTAVGRWYRANRDAPLVRVCPTGAERARCMP